MSEALSHLLEKVHRITIPAEHREVDSVAIKEPSCVTTKDPRKSPSQTHSPSPSTEILSHSSRYLYDISVPIKVVGVVILPGYDADE